MAAYAEGLNILAHADVGSETGDIDVETTPLRDPWAYQYDINLAEVAEVWPTRIGRGLLASRSHRRCPGPLAPARRVHRSGLRFREGRWRYRAGPSSEPRRRCCRRRSSSVLPHRGGTLRRQAALGHAIRVRWARREDVVGARGESVSRPCDPLGAHSFSASCTVSSAVGSLSRRSSGVGADRTGRNGHRYPAGVALLGQWHRGEPAVRDHGIVGFLLGEGLSGIEHVAGFVRGGSVGLSLTEQSAEPLLRLLPLSVEKPSRPLVIHATLPRAAGQRCRCRVVATGRPHRHDEEASSPAVRSGRYSRWGTSAGSPGARAGLPERSGRGRHLGHDLARPQAGSLDIGVSRAIRFCSSLV